MATSVMPQSEHERLKMRWDQQWGSSDRPYRHDKTAVLQLSWKQPHDDLKVGPELSRLGDVFRDVYGFKVRHALLDAHKAQQQALRELSTFVHEEDEKRALLIIYFAGHGHGDNVNIVPGDLLMEGKSTPTTKLDVKTGILWSKAEYAIRETEADVLLIFDCCEAGRLARSVRNGLPKSLFQFLGACSETETTMGPGDESFTTALIWALEQLAEEASPFSTAKLRHKITQYDKFPRSQMPILSERRAPFGNIMISVQGAKHEALELAPSALEREQEMERREHIDLRFHFKHEVDEDHIDSTVDGLRDLLHRQQSQWIKVSFLAKSSEYLMVQRYAAKWREHTLVGRKREPSIATNGHCTQALTELQPSQSPAAATPSDPFGLPIQLPRLTVPGNRSRELSPRRDDDGASHMSGWTEVGKESSPEDSVMFHVRAIVRTLRLQLSSAFSRMARWLLPRSGYERIPEEDA